MYGNSCLTQVLKHHRVFFFLYGHGSKVKRGHDHAFGHGNKHSKYVIRLWIYQNNYISTIFMCIYMSGRIWFECRCVTEKKIRPPPSFPVDSRLLKNELIKTRSWTLPRWHWIILYGYSPRSPLKRIKFPRTLKKPFHLHFNLGQRSIYIRSARKVLQMLMQTLLPLHLLASCGDPCKSFPNGF